MSKILVVEDNPELSVLLRDLLTSHGFEVVSCEDGMQGVAFVHKQKPDLILLDIMLPAGGGFHVLENVKRTDLKKNIPVVVLTASKDEEHKRRSSECGVEAYLEKPYDPEELVKTIKELLQDS